MTRENEKLRLYFRTKQRWSETSIIVVQNRKRNSLW